MKKLIISALLFFALMIPSTTAAFDQTGMSLSTGSQVNGSVVGAEDSDNNIYWQSIGVFGENLINKDWYVSYEADIGKISWESKKTTTTTETSHKKHRHGHYQYRGYCDTSESVTVVSKGDQSDSYTLEGKAVLMRYFKHFDLGIGGGLALMENSDVDLVQGLLTARVRIPLSEHIGLDLNADHMSSLGSGLNVNVFRFRMYATF